MARCLLDTNILIMVLQHGVRLTQAQRNFLLDAETELVVSTVCIWEMTIKWRKGKLALSVPPQQVEPVLGAMRIGILPFDLRHGVADPQIDRALKDPFDRIVAAIAEQEHIPFMATDAKLLNHPLAWHP